MEHVIILSAIVSFFSPIVITAVLVGDKNANFPTGKMYRSLLKRISLFWKEELFLSCVLAVFAYIILCVLFVPLCSLYLIWRIFSGEFKGRKKQLVEMKERREEERQRLLLQDGQLSMSEDKQGALSKV